MCCKCGGGISDSTSNSSSDSTQEPISLSIRSSYPYAIVMITLEIIGWIMFYIGKRDSLKYAEFLIDKQERNEIVDNFSINDTFDF